MARFLVPLLLLIGVTIAMAKLVRTAEAPPPKDPKLLVEGRTIVSKPLGLRLPVPPEWTLDAPQSGPDVLLTSPAHGASIVGKAITRDHPLEAALTEVEDLHRQRYGKVEDVERRDTRLAHLPGRLLALTVPTPNGLVRSEVTVARSGSYELSVTCSGRVDTFAVASEGCAALLGKLELK